MNYWTSSTTIDIDLKYSYICTKMFDDIWQNIRIFHSGDANHKSRYIVRTRL